jgi:hypothetical protein
MPGMTPARADRRGGLIGLAVRGWRSHALRLPGAARRRLAGVSPRSRVTILGAMLPMVVLALVLRLVFYFGLAASNQPDGSPC